MKKNKPTPDNNLAWINPLGGLGEIMADPQRKQLEQRTAHLKKGRCGQCRFWSLCHGGCPLDSWFSHGDFQHKTNWCYAKRGFIEKYFEPVTGIRYAAGGGTDK